MMIQNTLRTLSPLRAGNQEVPPPIRTATLLTANYLAPNQPDSFQRRATATPNTPSLVAQQPSAVASPQLRSGALSPFPFEELLKQGLYDAPRELAEYYRLCSRVPSQSSGVLSLFGKLELLPTIVSGIDYQAEGYVGGSVLRKGVLEVGKFLVNDPSNSILRIPVTQEAVAENILNALVKEEEELHKRSPSLPDDDDGLHEIGRLYLERIRQELHSPRIKTNVVILGALVDKIRPMYSLNLFSYPPEQLQLFAEAELISSALP